MNQRSEDLKERMNERFDDVDRRFDEVHRRMDERFSDVDKRMGERFSDVDKRMDERFDRVDERFEEIGKHLGRVDVDVRELRVAVNGMQRVMTHGIIAICTIMIAGFGLVVA